MKLSKLIITAVIAATFMACGPGRGKTITSAELDEIYQASPRELFYIGTDNKSHRFRLISEDGGKAVNYSVDLDQIGVQGWIEYSKTNTPAPFEYRYDAALGTAMVIVEAAGKETDDTLQGLDPEYAKALSLFPDMTIGVEHNGDGTLLPNEGIFANFYYMPQEEIEAGGWEEVYAIGKIRNYRGFDILIMESISERADEGSYDNHGGSYRFAVFHDGDGLLHDPADEGLMVRSLESSYFGEGGEAEMTSWFDRDTTVVTREWASESESATGYSTPFVSEKTYRWNILDGKEDIIEVVSMEFSSPFYDMDFIAEGEEAWINSDYRNYPQSDDRWSIDLYPYSDIRLTVHLEEDSGYNLVTVFESRNPDGTKVIDRYTVGGEQDLKSYPKQSPVTIKTSEGRVQVLADGRFGNPQINQK